MIVFFAALLSIIFLTWISAKIIKINPFHPTLFFIAAAAVDVFIPAILWPIFGYPSDISWMPVLTEEKVIAGLSFYTIFFSIFISTLILTSFNLKTNINKITLSNGETQRLTTALLLSLALSLIIIIDQISSAGSINGWLSKKLILTGARVTGEADDFGFIERLKPQLIFTALVGLAFFYRDSFRYKWIYTYAMPFIAVLLALSTTYRGSVFFAIVTLFFSEYLRIHSKKNITAGKLFFQKRISNIFKPKINKKLIKIGFSSGLALTFMILIYTPIRNAFRADAVGGDFTLSKSNMLMEGSGLQSISHILTEYGNSVEYLYGKTYIDMLLLPIPRSIYTSKPAWYGIDDITRAMGWPESTMSAVTMPGEAFANFGFIGLFIAIIFAYLFALLFRASKKTPYHYILLTPTISFSMMSTTNWMSFTGFMNAMISFTLLYLTAELLKIKFRL